MKKVVTINIIKIDEVTETIETPYLLYSDELTDKECEQLYDDCNLEYPQLMKVNEITDVEVKEYLKRYFDGEL